ncbi:DNA-directed RNA polymerase subunit D [Candidatus Woesearchaeota archaeon]|nr:DNA-directed RNA polymerase subunit D [Candidatus Woesearchaeota archaeon]
MKLEKLKEERKKNKFSFLIKDGDEVFANTIRRLILEEVPTLAVEDIEVNENNSALYDEMLGLRIGLIPIKTDLKTYVQKSKCKCNGEGCARCEMKMTLKSSKKGYVYAEEAKSTDPKCSFVYPTMPVVKLLAKQKVDLQMTAVLGKGLEHIKWAPGMAFYKKEPVLTVENVKDAKAVAEKCTDGVLELKGSKLSVNKDLVYESNLLEYYAELDKGITLEYTDNLIFTLESWGQLTHKEILNTAVDILIEKVEEMEKQL